MTLAALRLRAEAVRDVDNALAHCLAASDTPDAALGFIDALQAAYTHMRRQPGTGSPRYAHELDIPGLRCWLLTRYPYAAFYFEQSSGAIDVWRVLHTRADMPEWLRPGPGER